MYSPDKLGAVQAEDEGVMSFRDLYTIPFSRQLKFASVQKETVSVTVTLIKFNPAETTVNPHGKGNNSVAK
jgi:hypothetical protein